MRTQQLWHQKNTCVTPVSSGMLIVHFSAKPEVGVAGSQIALPGCMACTVPLAIGHVTLQVIRHGYMHDWRMNLGGLLVW